jgi:hypothetical protein
MIDINKFMTRFCDAGAEAVEEYDRISGEGPGDMPEYFMPAMIVHGLGSDFTMTLETKVKDLRDWNKSSLQRRGQTPGEVDVSNHSNKSPVKGSRRVDLVVFEGAGSTTPKEEQDIFLLAEFKKGLLDVYNAEDTDEFKLRSLASELQCMKWGVLCGSMEKSKIKIVKKELTPDVRLRWRTKDITLIDPDTRPLVFFAATFDAKKLRD